MAPLFDGLFGADQAASDGMLVDGQAMNEFLSDDCRYDTETQTIHCGDIDE